EDEALFGGGLALEHLRAVHDVGVPLGEIVAGTGRDVVAVGPDRRPRIVGVQRTLEQVAVVGTERVGARADGVADGVGAPGAPAGPGDAGLLPEGRLVEGLRWP